MICSNCQKENKEGSRFCQFCGTPMPLPEEAPVAVPEAEPIVELVETPAEEPIVEETRVVTDEPATETVVEVAPEVTPAKTKKEKKAKKEKGKKPIGLIILSVLMILLFLASAGLNVYQYYQQKNKTEENKKAVEELNTTILALEDAKADIQRDVEEANETIEELQDTIDEMTESMNAEAEILDAYDRLTYSLGWSEWGYYSDEFCTDYYLVYLAPGEEFEITLYTLWEGAGTVDIYTDTDYATAEFMQNEWSEEVGVLLTGVKEGMTVVTFTWDDEKSFDVIVFVEE